MKTKYWNEYTNEVFDTEEEAMASEKKYLDAQEAKKHYNEVLKAFCKDYGSFHYSTNDLKNYNLFDLFDAFNW